MPDNHILDASNNPLDVTNFGTADATLNRLGGLPLGTADGSATGEVVVKTKSTGGVAPTGSATSAKQDTQITAEQAILAKLPTVGTAGTASTNVITVQGIAGGTAAPISNTSLTDFGAGEYETVAASQTAQILGTTGAAGDYIAGLLVIPATTSPGLVTLIDGATSIPVFVGGSSSVSNLVPFFIPLGYKAITAFKVTTGANVSVIGSGNFT